MSIIAISPRLMPGIRIGGAWISAYPSPADASDKPSWLYYIDAEGFSYESDDLQSWGNSREVLGAILSFLSAAAEARSYRERTGIVSENEDLFPPYVVEWAYQNSDEIGAAKYEIEEEGREDTES